MSMKERSEEVCTCITRLEELLVVTLATTDRQVAESTEEHRRLETLSIRLARIQKDLSTARRDFETLTQRGSGDDARDAQITGFQLAHRF